MHLHKWYLDLVTPQGGVFIGYAARARWLGRTLHYAAVLLAPPEEQVTEHIARDPLAWPRLEKGMVHWSCPALGVSGQWNGTCPPVRATLLEGNAGSIEWCCHLPRAKARVEFAGTVWQGIGYAEELTTTLAPWSMPFATLRWGRFLSERDSIVWIDWSGGLERTWVFHNGQADSVACVNNTSIEITGGTLGLSPGRTLRDAALARTLFARWPALARLLPGGFHRARETKWLAPATLERTDRVLETGFALHEVVRWR